MHLLPTLPSLLLTLAFHTHTILAQQITAISQAPGFSSLASCAQNVAVAVIDDSTSPECPGGSPPKCFCGAEAASREYSDQISTNVLNSCSASPRPEATQAASVFAAYCSLGIVSTTGSSLSTAVSSSTGSGNAAAPSSSTTASTSTTTSSSVPSSPTSSSRSSGWAGLSTVAQIFTILGPIIAIAIFGLGLCLEARRRKKKKLANTKA